MGNDLIFDIGLHKGEDTEFYLKKGFRVVAVEANPDLCAIVSERLSSAIASGKLVIVNKALAREPGIVTFYKSEKSVWGTLDPEWAERNQRMGTQSAPCEIEATDMASLIAQFGAPYYAKFDIEGFDLVGLEGLSASAERPRYVSIESEKDSFKGLRKEFSVLESLGYDRFKIVPQHEVPSQISPKDPSEGIYAAHDFMLGCSGLFGEEAPGQWLTRDEAIEAYKPIFMKYALIGDDPIGNKWLGRFLRHVLRQQAGWYDTHARLSDESVRREGSRKEIAHAG
jgi:FkbM family methyltransferase